MLSELAAGKLAVQHLGVGRRMFDRKAVKKNCLEQAENSKFVTKGAPLIKAYGCL